MRKAVILAGGKGTRLHPYTLVFPKPLMPLGETPILDIVLRQLARRGFEEVVLSVGYLAELIESYVGDGSRFGLRTRYVRESKPLGTAGALSLIDGLDEPFLVMNGDVLTTLDYAAFLDAHVASGAAASVSTACRKDVTDFGVIESDLSGEITAYLEKPSREYQVSMGVNALSPAALELVPRDQRFDMPQLIEALLASGYSTRAVPFSGYWLDIGRHDDFTLAQDEFAQHRSEFLGEGS